MAAYVFMIPPRAVADDEEAVVVRDGFAFLAFLVPVLWFAFHRMWLWAAGFLVLGLALSLAGDRTGWYLTALVLGLLANLWAGLEAGTMRVARLERDGWREADVVVAPDRRSAEEIHFANVASAGDVGRAPAAGPEPAGPRPRTGGDGPALGLFDYDGDR